jgi:hypothetical protein
MLELQKSFLVITLAAHGDEWRHEGYDLELVAYFIGVPYVSFSVPFLQFCDSPSSKTNLAHLARDFGLSGNLLVVWAHQDRVDPFDWTVLDVSEHEVHVGRDQVFLIWT